MIWIRSKGNDRLLLLTDNDCTMVYAFVTPSDFGIKARRLRSPKAYSLERDNYLDILGAERDSVYGPKGKSPDTVEEAKLFIEAALGIIIDKDKNAMLGDILQFLGKIKEYEVRGRIELIIKVEGYQPIVK